MLECQNCGSHVTEQYARVFTPPSVERPRACPYCQDVVRSGAQIRESHSTSN